MSDEEFLRRWSRRKQEAKAAEQGPPLPAAEAQDAAVTGLPHAGQEPEFDLSKLPPIDSITAATDITAFLGKNIPAELSRAALRRAWAADPAIRDFVGLAENAWDFTDPNAMPGFGALQGTPEQIGAMVERIIGGVRDTAEKLASESSGNEQDQQKSAQASASATSDTPANPAAAATSQPDASAEPVIATQPEASVEQDHDVAVRRRTHGGALPT